MSDGITDDYIRAQDLEFRLSDANRENARLRAEIEEWRAKLAEQCGHTLAMQALLNREMESNSRRDCPG